MLRFLLAASAVALMTVPAAAGGGGCVGDCYRQDYVGPTYNTVTERYITRAPRTYAYTVPARYATSYATVQVSPGSRYWSVSYDAWGRKIGCWVTTPPRYATVGRTVMVQAPQVVPVAEPAQYGYRSHVVQTSPGYRTWTPIGRGGGFGLSSAFGLASAPVAAAGYGVSAATGGAFDGGEF